ncbi:hypothetical protein PtB15_17B221 [Puccinia triticina]|nr:hypothetical protein PtB15_17B221 [Puccinia triticina]
MLLDRKSSRSSGLPRFKPSTHTLKQPPLSPQADAEPAAYSLPPISSLAAIKHWFDPAPPSPSLAGPAPARALFPSTSPSPPQPHLSTGSPVELLDAAIPPPPAAKQSLKPLRNSIRKRTPSSLFARRLSSASLLKSKLTSEQPEKPPKNRNSAHHEPQRPTPPLHAASKPSNSPPVGGKDPSHTPSSPKAHSPPRTLLSPKRKLLSPSPKKHAPPSPATTLKTLPSHHPRPGPAMNLLSLGIQYNPALRPDPAPAPVRDPPAAPVLKPGPRGSSLHPFSRAAASPTSPFATTQFSPARLASRSSTMTLASTCTTGSDDEFRFSDLVSIQLPSTPTAALRPSPAGRPADLLSDFPLPPSRDAFLPPSFDLLSHGPHSEPVDLLSGLPRRLNYSPSLPPQIPLPPLPATRGFRPPSLLHSWFPLAFPDKTPTQPPTEAMPAPSPNPFESPDISSTSYNLDDLLDLYDTHTSPDSFKRTDRPTSSTAVDGPKQALDLKAMESSNLLDVDLPSRTSSPDHLSSPGEELAKDDEETLIVRDQQGQSLSKIQPLLDSASEGEEETASEIDLDEPLDMMAVRLGYQLHLADGSDSDSDDAGRRPLRRAEELDDDDALLDAAPVPFSRGPSRQQGLFQVRSLSSLRAAHRAPSRSRTNRVVIAEASSSDEEEFDLKLDHDHRATKHDGEEPWRGGPEWRRSSVGSAGTLGSFTTTPSSSHSSYQTRFSSPADTLVFPPDALPKTCLGLGFHIHPPPSPLLPGATDRRLWLQRAFAPRDAPAQPRSASLPGPSSKPSSSSGPVHSAWDEDDGASEAVPDQLSDHLDRPRASYRLKPLMLVSRKDRHLSFPLLHAPIAEEAAPAPPASVARTRASVPAHLAYRPVPSSCSSATARPPGAPPRNVRVRASLVSLSYHRSAGAPHPLLLARPAPL